MIAKRRPLILALAVALVLLLSLSTAAFADGTTTGTIAQAKGTVCVDGYVINHRELPVDGTKTVPALVVEALQGTSANGATAQAAQGALQAAVGSNGYFKFEELPAGEWNFQMLLPEEWEGIVPATDANRVAQTGMTSFAEKKGCYRIVFKVRRLIEIVVLKWEEDLDGKVTPGVGWEITVTPVNDPFVKPQTAKTDDSGRAGFTLTPGHWIISEKLKDGWTPITPQKLHVTLDQYSEIGARPPIVFKNRAPACYGAIDVQKLGYGTDPQGMVVPLGPLGGWKVTLSRADNTMPPVTKVTDGEGKVSFAKLQPGVYKVKEAVQVGWAVRGANPQTVVIDRCETEGVVFENDEVAGTLTIYGKKLFKAWEKPYKGELVGLAGWEITATLVGTETSVKEVTDALGQYRFTEAELKAAGLAIAGASIQVCEEDRDNWIHVTPKCVTVKFPYPVPDDYAGVEVNFTNIQDPPLGEGVMAAPAAGGVCTTYHTVSAGDTLAKIAGAYQQSMRSIIAANGIRNADVIFLGQKLCIP